MQHHRARLVLGLLVATLSLCLCTVGLAVPSLQTSSYAADDKGKLKKQQGSVQKKLNAAQSDADESNAALLAASRALDRANAKLASARAELSRTRGKLAVAKAVDARLRGQLAVAEADLAKAESALTSATGEYSSSRKQVEQFAVDGVINHNPGLETLGKLLDGSTVAELTQTETTNDTIADAQTASMQRLDAVTVMLQVQEKSAQKLRNAVAAKKAQAARNVTTMAALTARAETQTASVASLVAARATVRAKAKKIADEDMRKVAMFEAERRRIKKKLAAIVARELARARAKRSGGSGGNSGGSGGTDGGGTLSRPVSGPITSPYGMRYHPIKHVWKLHDGTDFGVACGTPVKAAAGGTIISQYYNSAYGYRLLLNNGIKRGVSVITIYNHLSSFKYSTGRRVSRGQVIAYSGTTGLSTGCHLHFMVLVNGNTVNPMGWL